MKPHSLLFERTQQYACLQKTAACLTGLGTLISFLVYLGPSTILLKSEKKIFRKETWEKIETSCSAHSLSPQKAWGKWSDARHFGCPERPDCGRDHEAADALLGSRTFREVTTCHGQLYWSETLEMIDKNHPISGKVWINSSSHVESKNKKNLQYNLPFNT